MQQIEKYLDKTQRQYKLLNSVNQIANGGGASSL